MAIRGMRWLYMLGSKGYDFLVWFQGWWEKFCWLFRIPRRSLSKYIRTKVKAAVNFVASFEEVMVRYAKDKECTTVIGGHIHTPNIITKDGVTYYNCGDWVEHNSAVIEHLDGTLEIVYYEDDDGERSTTIFETND
jgi:UDP-2,3-diacylglucosamine pyrophosphatase LpxH